MESTIRRVITGVDENGASRVALDETLPREIATRIAVTNIWSAGPSPIDNRLPLESGTRRFNPSQMADGGHGFMLIEFAPGFGRDDPGMHHTDTADQFFVVDGAIVLILDTEEVTLHRGDAGVLRGIRHGWRNETDNPALIVTTTLPALPLAG